MKKMSTESTEIKHSRNSARVWVDDKSEAIDSALRELEFSIKDIEEKDLKRLTKLLSKISESSETVEDSLSQSTP
ncbi:hypothetical protein BALOs_2972 [Halobacteriovorax sp. BALOs_7]|uniref:hypothetical protein n=1 Tax=Halobacteriovorax sp. BALOs_7 TaxID=2109558 RepID=UPI000EB75117|nr:hypothetical protein [Halobacteriovorax sp. BALOs_7]AYF45954.1 hypothetical protein BALOs_2972 [Halobacteriovorax sp. BALOs_7]